MPLNCANIHLSRDDPSQYFSLAILPSWQSGSRGVALVLLIAGLRFFLLKRRRTHQCIPDMLRNLNAFMLTVRLRCPAKPQHFANHADRSRLTLSIALPGECSKTLNHFVEGGDRADRA